MKLINFWKSIFWMAVIAFAVSGFSASGQETSANINGTVHDSTGAVVNNATVTATNLGTNAHVTTKSQNGGEYTLLNLDPGTYNLTVTATGFESYQQTGIVLNINQHASVDVALQLGSVAQQVTVTADVTGLDKEASTVSSEVNNAAIAQLPLNTRESYALLELIPGFNGSIGNDYNAVGYTIDGGRSSYGDILVDGTPAGFPTVNGVQGVGVFPSVDAIGEFRLLAQDFPAEYGRTLDGIVNVVFKSGTNKFHGSLFEFLRTANMDANDFFSNRNHVALPAFHRDQYGGLFSGPIFKDKTFFLVSTEILTQNSFQSITTTVPTLLQRNGDFSQTFGPNGALQKIYDPYTTTKNGSVYTRTQYANNNLNSEPGELSKVGFNVLKYYPLPNVPGNTITNANNYFATGSVKQQTIAWDVRVDHNLSPRQRVFARYSNRYYESNPGPLFPAADAVAEGLIDGEDFSRGVTAGYNTTITPNLLFDARLGFARTLYNYLNNSLGYQDSTLGLPGNIDAAPGVTPLFPQMDPAGYDGLGNNGQRHNAFMTYALLSSLTWQHGKHIIKGGFDGRIIRVNDNEASYGAGGYTFGTNWTQQDPNTASAYSGNGLASMLIGEGTGYVIQDYKNVATQSFYYAGYLQDDWRILPNLTLNLGVRYDIETPRTERFNRMNYFDPAVESPLANDVPGLSGGLVFVGVNGVSRHQYIYDSNNFAPRIGFAYEPLKSTVVHGGFAIVYGASNQAAAGTVGPYGWRVQTNWVNTLDNITPYQCPPAPATCLGGNLDNPFPQGFSTPPGSADGLWTGAGSLMEGVLQRDPVPYTIQYGLDVQQQLPLKFTADIAYVGNRGRQEIQSGEGGMDFDQLPVGDLSLGSALNTQVPNPFYGDPRVTGTLSAPTVSREQLLVRYPQYLEMWPLRYPGGNSAYDGLQFTLDRRLAGGIQVKGSYVLAKNFDNNTTHQDTFNTKADYAISSNDIHQRFIFSYIYQLPFGRGRRYGARIAAWEDAIVGGWNLNGITTLQGGQPLRVTGNNTLSTFDYQDLWANTNFQNPGYNGPVKNRLNKYFNTGDFSQPASFTLGNGPAYYNHLRSPGLDSSDFSIVKDFKPYRTTNLQFRAEAFNVFNHPQFSSPNTNVTSASFGIITGQANSPRQLQVGLKLTY